MSKTTEKITGKKSNAEVEPHSYGGWYCPDNLSNFPPIDIKEWSNVSVVNNRMATKEETQNGTSLIFVDQKKYPNAKPLNLTMPKLARYYNYSSQRNEIIIVIQALNINNDSIVGFRYLNGGNGSARLKDVSFISDNEANKMLESKFVTLKIEVKATKNKIWDILIKPAYSSLLQPTFDKGNVLPHEWRLSTNINYYYPKSGKSTALYTDEMFGNYYIQNDYKYLHYTEKIFLSENSETKTTEFTIVCGPFDKDFEVKKMILNNWAEKVKELSEVK